MTRMTVRDVRLHWAKAEKALAEGEEIVVTRDSKPVARLLPFVGRPKARRKPFDPKAHMRWLNKLWKGGRGHRLGRRRPAFLEGGEVRGFRPVQIYAPGPFLKYVLE
jgi:antitoxin (DNA-binding transcriptional repressor) of toxin-antitoxin stability system